MKKAGNGCAAHITRCAAIHASMLTAYRIDMKQIMFKIEYNIRTTLKVTLQELYLLGHNEINR